MGFQSLLYSLLVVRRFIQDIFIKHLLCVRHCAKCWGYNGEKDKIPSLPSEYISKTDNLTNSTIEYEKSSERCSDKGSTVSARNIRQVHPIKLSGGNDIH